MDSIDGAEVPPRIIRWPEVIDGLHQGTVIVEAGGSLQLTGVLQGTLVVQAGAAATVAGAQQGTVQVDRAATLDITGVVQGTVRVDDGGLVRVHPDGQLQGTLSVDGTVENAGTRGGATSGAGVIDDRPGSRVVQPRMVNGDYYYDW